MIAVPAGEDYRLLRDVSLRPRPGSTELRDFDVVIGGGM